MAKRVSLKGKGADLFFGDYDPAQAPHETAIPPPDPALAAATDDALPTPVPSTEEGETAPPILPSASTSRSRGQKARRTNPSAPPVDVSMRASGDASTLASTDASTIEAIRKVVKVPGREVSFVRLTAEEKADLADIVYTYRRQGQKTSENEINRVAINYLLADYHDHGAQSVLARVLAALIA